MQNAPTPEATAAGRALRARVDETKRREALTAAWARLTPDERRARTEPATRARVGAAKARKRRKAARKSRRSK